MESQVWAITKHIGLGVLIAFLCGTTQVSAATYLGKKSITIDTDGVVVTGNGLVGIGTAAPSAQMEVSGNMLFDGPLITPPEFQQNNASIRWDTHSAYHIVFDDAPPVTQSITFDEAPSTTVQRACMLFLLVRRNCGITFPNTVKWKGNATGSFAAPATGFQEDIYGFLYDGLSTYYGFVNLDFKADATFPGGR